MNRGVVIATAHVRGGGEMGRDWYEKEGKFLTKKNTFFDFQGVRGVPDPRGWTEPAKLAVTGRSAGGLLVGAVVNLDPSLFRCAVAAVPFVDVMTSMCDASIPLTTGEWEEWGNPNEREFHEYMLSLCPWRTFQNQASTRALGRTCSSPAVCTTRGWRTGRGRSTRRGFGRARGTAARGFCSRRTSRGALLRERSVQVLPGEGARARVRAGRAGAER